MAYMGGQAYWDRKFVKRDNQILNPEQSLVEHIRFFKKGSVLDIACGDGRNALFLLENHFKVTGVDFSGEALNRLNKFAAERKYAVHTIQMDLSDLEAWRDIGVFDNVVINHYRLGKNRMSRMNEHLADGGVLFVCGFGHKHQDETSVREEDLIQPADFEDVERVMERLAYVEHQDRNGFFVTYVFRKA
ncbi:class I SAM-dependent methyltransferase [Cohnella nanjingensis]|uniref:Class I SAM-dependent methyltransferase n=1 Tax=Cohnella nanjingensis TaxID=1387779 RepID=A0A7X0RWE5_9BACL|nr:class I SAM-dependent methyltransferase [Cohnella nanjingensis]MBB6673339.1 class I SAM-dependent methyltransferase [Cohnella nanjingensis]